MALHYQSVLYEIINISNTKGVILFMIMSTSLLHVSSLIIKFANISLNVTNQLYFLLSVIRFNNALNVLASV